MKNHIFILYFVMKRFLVINVLLGLFTISGFSQKIVGLDNWFNHETNANTGKVYHYTWDDQAESGYSQLGDLFVKSGGKLETIKANPSFKSLKGVDIYIIVDPDTTRENPAPNYVSENDVSFLKKWVSKGGILVLLANDGPNCEFTHFNQLAKEFGFYFQPITLNQVTNNQFDMAAETDLPNHPLFAGVKKIYMKEVSPIILSKNANPVLTDKEHVLIGEANFGKGYVLAIGDPWLYNEYIDHAHLPDSFENLKAANNLVNFLLEKVK